MACAGPTAKHYSQYRRQIAVRTDSREETLRLVKQNGAVCITIRVTRENTVRHLSTFQPPDELQMNCRRTAEYRVCASIQDLYYRPVLQALYYRATPCGSIWHTA